MKVYGVDISGSRAVRLQRRLSAVPRPPKLSRPQIVDAALVLADEVGTDGLTMRALARRLGVDPMAVYRHVTDKDDLLGAMCDAVLAELPELDGAGGWEAEVVRLTDALLEMLVRRPALIPVLAGAPATPASVAVSARALRVLVDAGADESVACAAWELLFALVLGAASIAATYEPATDPSAVVEAARALTAEEDVALLPVAGRLATSVGTLDAARALALDGVRLGLTRR